MGGLPVGGLPVGGLLGRPPRRGCEWCWVLLVAACFLVLTYSHLLYGQMWGEVQDVLRESPTYVTPDSATFIVWVFIYALEAVFVLSQFCPSERGEELLRLPCPLCLGLPVRVVVSLVFLANALWMPLFAAELFGWSCLLSAVFLWVSLGAYATLTAAAAPLCCARAGAPFSCHRLVYVAPVAANVSWLVVVSASNFMMWVGADGRQDEYGVAGNPGSALLVVAGVALLACALAFLYCDLVWATVTAWSLAGVCRMQTVADAARFPVGALNPTVAAVSGFCIALVAASAAAGLGVAVVGWHSGRRAAGSLERG